jgi:hypothetical protein
LNVLDTFNRATALHLNATGFPWTQVAGTSTTAASALQVFDLVTTDTTTGVAYCNNTGTPNVCATVGTAYWPLSPTGAKQAAAFQFDNTLTTSNNQAPGYSLILKATSINGNTDVALDSVRVTYLPPVAPATTGSVRVSYTVNSGLSYTTVGTITPVTFAAGSPGDTMGAMVDNTGKVWVWQTRGITNTLLGAAQLPTTTATWTTGTGIIGIQLPPGAQVDNFAGGLVP